MTARERLELMIERLEAGLPLVEQGHPWIWPEADAVWVDQEPGPRWLPE